MGVSSGKLREIKVKFKIEIEIEIESEIEGGCESYYINNGEPEGRVYDYLSVKN
jgi:hypothetical protein